MNARALFGVAAIFNVVVGVAMLLAYDALAPWLGLPPQPTVWVHLVALIVLVFGYAYWRVARIRAGSANTSSSAWWRNWASWR